MAFSFACDNAGFATERVSPSRRCRNAESLRIRKAGEAMRPIVYSRRQTLPTWARDGRKLECKHGPISETLAQEANTAAGGRADDR